MYSCSAFAFIVVLVWSSFYTKAQEYVVPLPSSIDLVAGDEHGNIALIGPRIFVSQGGGRVVSVLGKNPPPRPSETVSYVSCCFIDDGRALLLATSGASGVYRYNISNDEWESAGPFSGGRHASAMAHAVSSDKILLGYGGLSGHTSSHATGAFLSTNDGETWTPLSLPDDSWNSWPGVQVIQPVSEGQWLVGFKGYPVAGSQGGLYLYSETEGWSKLSGSFRGKTVATTSYAFSLVDPTRIQRRSLDNENPQSRTINIAEEIIDFCNIGTDTLLLMLRGQNSDVMVGILSSDTVIVIDTLDMHYSNIGKLKCSEVVGDGQVLIFGGGYQRRYTDFMKEYDSIQIESPAPKILDAFSIGDRVYSKVKNHGWLSFSMLDSSVSLTEIPETFSKVSSDGNDSWQYLSRGQTVVRYNSLRLDTIANDESFVIPGELPNDITEYNGWITITTNFAVYSVDTATMTISVIDTSGWHTIDPEGRWLRPKTAFRSAIGYIVWIQGNWHPKDVHDIGGYYLKQGDGWLRIEGMEALGRKTSLERAFVSDGRMLTVSYETFPGSGQRSSARVAEIILPNFEVNVFEDNVFDSDIASLGLVENNSFLVSTDYGQTSYLLNDVVHTSHQFGALVGSGVVSDFNWLATKDSSLLLIKDLLQTVPVKEQAYASRNVYKVFPVPCGDEDLTICGLQEPSVIQVISVDGAVADCDSCYGIVSESCVYIRTDSLACGRYTALIQSDKLFYSVPFIIAR